jgi:Protein of unknown function (DUF4199)
MWTIGIKSGLITVLGLVAYGLIVQMMRLEQTLWGNLDYVVLSLGIYAGHYYYKAANNGFMTYKQGLKLGLINISFTGLVSALPIYLSIKFIDASFIMHLTKNVQRTLQQKGIDEAVIAKVLHAMQHMTPEFLLIGTFVSTVLLGLSFTLAIAVFSRHPQKTIQT